VGFSPGNARRAIDIHEGEETDESAFKALILQAVALIHPSPNRKSQLAPNSDENHILQSS
jgi:hypothetical protein